MESKAGRDALGLGEEVVDGNRLPTSLRGPDYLIRLLRKLLEDVASGAIDTRLYNKASQIKEYFDELPTELRAASDEAGSELPKKFRELTTRADVAPSVSPEPTTSQAPPTTRATKLRDTLAPKQLEFNQPANAKGQQFIREATRIKLKEARLSSAFLLRGFIQFVVDLYMIDNNIPFREGQKQLEMHVRAERVIDHLIANKKAKRADLSGIKRRLAERANSNPSSIQALNDYHHAQYQVPDVDALRLGWDDATPLFIAVLGRPTK